MAARVLLAALAVAAGAWLAVQHSAARAEDELTYLAFEATAPPPERESERLLERARRLNPDRRPDLFEGAIRARQGRTEEAIEAIRRVNRAEPENVQGWTLLAQVARRADPALAQRARTRARRLAPPVG